MAHASDRRILARNASGLVILLSPIDANGIGDVVGVDHTIAPGLEGIGNATAIVGEDGHVYWTETTEDGDVLIVRYTHPVRDPSP